MARSKRCLNAGRNLSTEFVSPMKIALLFVLMSTIVMIAYLTVPAQAAAEAKARR